MKPIRKRVARKNLQPLEWGEAHDESKQDSLDTSSDLDGSQSQTLEQTILLSAKGGGIAFVGNLFTYFFRFLLGIVLARLLGAELLGVYSLGLTITEVVGVISLFGLSAALVRYIPIAINQKDSALLWGNIQIGIVIPSIASLLLAFGVFLFAEPLSYRLFNRPDLVPVLRVACFSIPLFALMSQLSSITRGFKRMEYQVYGEDITLYLLKLILSVVFWALGLGVIGFVLAHNIALAVAAGMLFYFVHRLFPLNRPLNTAQRNVREMFSFSLPIYMTRVLERFSGSIEALILGYLGLVSGIGIYTTALRLSGIGGLFHQSLQRIGMPIIADLSSRREFSQLERVYQTMTKWEMTFNLPIFLTIVLYAGPLLSIFGEEFIAGATGLIILAFATLFNASTGMCGAMVTMSGHSKLTFINSIIYLIVNITLDVLLIPRWGIVGAALAVTLTGVTINILRTIQVFVLLRIWPYERVFLKPIAASLLAVGIAYLVGQWLVSMPLILQVAVGASLLWGVYGLMIILLKLSEEDRLVLSRLLARFHIRRS